MAHNERIVFFDVGNVLVNEDPFLCETLRYIYEAIPSSSPRSNIDRFLGDVERHLRQYRHMAVERLGYRHHGRQWPRIRKEIQKKIEKRWWDLVGLIPKSKEALEEVRRDYPLGIIANQPLRIIECLREWEILPLFDVVVLDSQFGIAKPDIALFRVALEEAKRSPELAMMVGDRLDNDIIPARRLGMKAILLWLSTSEKGWEPSDEWGRHIWAILDRLPVPRWDSIHPKERPNRLVRSWDETPHAVRLTWDMDHGP
jgi:HAD superfamily hydrolase (TIGR01549 family)